MTFCNLNETKYQRGRQANRKTSQGTGKEN